MAANIPDQGAIANLGGQFNTQHNVFDAAQKHFSGKSKKYAQAHNTQVRQTANAREKFAQSAASTVTAGRKAYAQGVQKQQKAAASAAKAHAQGVKSGRVAPSPGAPPRTFAVPPSPQQKNATKTMQQQRNNAHGQAINMQNQMNRAATAAAAVQQRHAVSIAAHRQKAAINLNLSQQKHQASTNAHATKAATSINALAQKQQMQQSHQTAMASGKQKAFDVGGAQKLQLQGYMNKQKLQHQANMQAQRQSQKPAKAAASPTQSGKAPSVPQTTPGFSNPTPTHTPIKPVSIATASFSSQLAPQRPTAGPQGSATASFSHSGSGSAPTPPAARSGSVTGPQFPQHVHPAGSSTTPLPNLTASQPRPNTFTTGSRNARPNGIAARGSQLEAWAAGRQQEVRKQRGSNNTQLRLGD